VAITGQQIRSERLMRKLTQQELAAAVGVSLRTIGRVERGEIEDSRTADTIAGHLGLTPTVPDDQASTDLTRVSVYSLLDEIARRALKAEEVLRTVGAFAEGSLPTTAEEDPGYTAGPATKAAKQTGQAASDE